MKVFEKFNIDDEAIEDRRGSSEYWDNVANFWYDVKHKHVDDISFRQESWLMRIEKGLIEQ